eukprot:5942161-Alexandrium_andersonii.AAC.1
MRRRIGNAGIVDSAMRYPGNARPPAARRRNAGMRDPQRIKKWTLPSKRCSSTELAAAAGPSAELAAPSALGGASAAA